MHLLFRRIKLAFQDMRIQQAFGNINSPESRLRQIEKNLDEKLANFGNPDSEVDPELLDLAREAINQVNARKQSRSQT